MRGAVEEQRALHAQQARVPKLPQQMRGTLASAIFGTSASPLWFRTMHVPVFHFIESFPVVIRVGALDRMMYLLTGI